MKNEMKKEKNGTSSCKHIFLHSASSLSGLWFRVGSKKEALHMGWACKTNTFIYLHHVLFVLGWL